jgi:molybdopterin-guanine dinucleotide biosynthesis protein A
MVTVAIQAGGQSRRMGRDKGLVLLAGRPMISHVIERTAELGDDILITTNQPADYAFLGLPMASDPVPGAGSLSGLHTALQAARGDTVVVLACDMPFVCAPLFEYMLRLSSESDVVIPLREGEFEPLHAVYRRSCLAALASALAAGEKRMISFFPFVRVRPVESDELDRFDPKGMSFFNVNTPAELEMAERLYRSQAPSDRT